MVHLTDDEISIISALIPYVDKCCACMKCASCLGLLEQRFEIGKLIQERTEDQRELAALRKAAEKVVNDARSIGAQSFDVLPEMYVKQHWIAKLLGVLHSQPQPDRRVGNERRIAVPVKLSEDGLHDEYRSGQVRRHASTDQDIVAKAKGEQS